MENRKVKFNKTKRLLYYLGRIDEKKLMIEEFKISFKRNVSERVNHGFIKTYKPIIDDTPYRIFERIGEYKDWCNKYLPNWLGYGKVK